MVSVKEKMYHPTAVTKRLRNGLRHDVKSISNAKMCRGCLFVIVDIPSGGDIESCWKQEIIERFYENYPKDTKIHDLLENEEKKLDEDQCFVGFWQPQPKNKDEFEKQTREWMECREKVIAAYERNLRKRVFFRR